MAYTGRDESVEFMWSEGRVGTQAKQSTNYYDGDSIESGAVERVQLLSQLPECPDTMGGDGDPINASIMTRTLNTGAKQSLIKSQLLLTSVQ